MGAILCPVEAARSPAADVHLGWLATRTSISLHLAFRKYLTLLRELCPTYRACYSKVMIFASELVVRGGAWLRDGGRVGGVPPLAG